MTKLPKKKTLVTTIYFRVNEFTTKKKFLRVLVNRKLNEKPQLDTIKF